MTFTITLPFCLKESCSNKFIVSSFVCPHCHTHTVTSTRLRSRPHGHVHMVTVTVTPTRLCPHGHTHIISIYMLCVCLVVPQTIIVTALTMHLLIIRYIVKWLKNDGFDGLTSDFMLNGTGLRSQRKSTLFSLMLSHCIAHSSFCISS